METQPTASAQRAARLLRQMFCLAVICLAVWRFSENTADPDLWGHVLFGQRMIATGTLELTEPFSWTAHGHPWINHEIGGELAMGFAHRALGGTGLLLLTFVVGLLTFGLALKMGGEGLTWPRHAVAWAMGALLAREIAFGFAVRPQIFTGLFFAVLIFALRRIHEGNNRWSWLLPPLFALWINTHGGALAGFAVLLVAASATSLQQTWSRNTRSENSRLAMPRVSLASLWLSVGGAAIALICNPWGYELVRWLVGSVLWFRPEITEWNPPSLGIAHAAMFVAVAVALVSFGFSTSKLRAWEGAVLAALAIAALRHERHIPLFSIAALALVPPHLSAVIERYRIHFKNLTDVFSTATARRLAAAMLAIGCVAMLWAAVGYRKERFYTMEADRSEFPVSAVEFMKAHQLNGKLLVFFDWGELCLWELPQCAVSIDGRLDTCYSREVIEEHWKFLYDGRPVNESILDLRRADMALLRSDLAGAATFERDPRWQLVYGDPLAKVFVRDASRFPELRDTSIPVRGSLQAVAGRSPFPWKSSDRVSAK